MTADKTGADAAPPTGGKGLAQLSEAEINEVAAVTAQHLRVARAEDSGEVHALPHVRTHVYARHALVVMRGYHYKEDLAMLKSYIREYKPVLIGVDGGADAILEIGRKPDIILGSLDSITEASLTCGADLVMHNAVVGDDQHARMEEAGIPAETYFSQGSNADAAMVLADRLGATLIVTVGSFETISELVDGDTEVVAASLVTRLQLGSKLIDAKGVALLYRRSISNLQILLLALAGLLALIVALAVTDAGQAIFSLIGAKLDPVIGWFASLLHLSPAEPQALSPNPIVS